VNRDDELRGLTFWRPWPTAMCRLGKDIENRPKPPPRQLIGSLVAIHTGQRFDASGAAKIARLTGVQLTSPDSRPGDIVGVFRLTGFVVTSSSPWFTGPYGLTFTDLRTIDPVPCKPKFALGWWRVPGEVAKVVLASYWKVT
jgi:hypothetical protein